ncbi:MAG TPA: hypothetical protein VLF94_06490 [Chlamydiales bacterium]|nr:hypothetical protein [Chlamydiales bacterium]
MASPIYDFLLSLQNCLGNCVSPELRAVTFIINEKKRGVYLCFLYDTEITEELEEEVSILLLEVNTHSSELEFRGYEVIQWDSSKLIPMQGGMAFLRYEKTLPSFERKSHAFLLREEDFPHHAIYRLDMQQALLGRVTPALRHVGVDADSDRKKLIAHFIYDGEISELNRQLALAAIQDSRISFPDFEMDFFIERVDYPNRMNHRGQWLAYWRKEWLFTDEGPTPAIRK